jgi:hypothetical protein
VVADTRLYLVFVGGPTLNPDHNPRVKHFFDSFAVTDPALLARGKLIKPKPPEPEPEPEPDDRDVMEVVKDFAQGGVRGAKRE